MMQVEVKKVQAFSLPDGSYITAEGLEADERWKSLAIRLVRPDGQNELVCAIEYESGVGLKTYLYDEEHEEPIHEQMVLSAGALE